jgi:hypothetical protein
MGILTLQADTSDLGYLVDISFNILFDILEDGVESRCFIPRFTAPVSTHQNVRWSSYPTITSV